MFDRGRVVDLRKSLVVCSTLERYWSCVRPWKEKELGGVFDPLHGREGDLGMSLVICRPSNLIKILLVHRS